MMTAAILTSTATSPAGSVKIKGLDFGAIYDQYAGKVHSKCFSMLKDKCWAEDVTQEIFMKIYLKISGFESKSKLSTWIYAITHNTCIDHLRKKKRKAKRREEALKENFEAYHRTDETPAFAIKEKKSDELHKILSNISFSEEEILRMKYELEMSIRDIASELEKTESAVKMKILRAKNKARKVKLELFSKN